MAIQKPISQNPARAALVVAFVAAAAFGSGLPELVRGPDGRDYFAGRLILKLAPGSGLAAVNLEPLEPDSLWPLYRPPYSAAAVAVGCDRTFGVFFRAAVSPVAAATMLGSAPGIEWAEPEVALELCRAPDDSLYGRQWHLPRIGAPAAWDVGTGDTIISVGLIDNGYEWHHPDIEPNIAINRLEDINGNGRFDPLPPPDGDLDGIDQDGNGFADDVVGFNFMHNSPNPEPDSVNLIHSHGTHCWGIANAVTDNRSGIAAAAWNCRAIACRCGTGPLMSPAAVVSAIDYLVARGVRVLSLSFGSPSPNQAIIDACAFARASGRLVVAGAGNNGDSIRFYPAASEHAIAVAGSDQNDYRPYWSNWGTWVDVAAPGASILSTIAGHDYGTISGTSMATPLVAGALAWIWAQDPSLAADSVQQILFSTCDSMPDPYFAQGFLGRGRISIGNIALRRTRSDLRVTGLRFNDATGNGNGRLDPGETASLIVRLANSPGWQNAAGITATLACAAPGVTVLRPLAAFPDIAAGDSADCSLDSFVVRADDSVPPRHLTLQLTIGSTPPPLRADTALAAICGAARVLIVDDDGGAGYESYYQAACDSNLILHSLYDVARSGSPTAETLVAYPVVIWFCGDDSVQTLTPMDRSAIVSYTRAGGNLFLSGQNVAQDLTRRQSGFLAEYLRAELTSESTGRMFLPGFRNDPVTRGETLVAGGTGGANNARSNDALRAVNGSEGCAFYRDFGDTTACAMIRYAGDYRLVFLAAPFEALNHSPNIYLQRWELLRRVLEWFGERIPGHRETGVSSSAPARRSGPTVLRGPLTAVPAGARVFDAAGRAVRAAQPGVYFIVGADGTSPRRLVISR